MVKKLNVMVCEENDCGAEIGFLSKRGRYHYDDGTVQNGFHFFCEKHGDKKDQDAQFPIISN